VCRGPGYRVEVAQRTDVGGSADLNPVVIGPAAEVDLTGIVEILNYTVAHSIASFATQPTSVGERRDWFEQFSSTGPYRLLVARRNNLLLGYACSQPYRDRQAFRETVEVSIALDVSCRGHGVGSLLYRALFERLADEPIHVVLAGIALPNDASMALHRKFGSPRSARSASMRSRTVGTLVRCGCSVFRQLLIKPVELVGGPSTPVVSTCGGAAEDVVANLNPVVRAERVLTGRRVRPRRIGRRSRHPPAHIRRRPHAIPPNRRDTVQPGLQGPTSGRWAQRCC
jgi:phosphinothricin acetyltransferase